QRWWQFARPRPELRTAIEAFRRVLVCSQTSKHRTAVFVDSDQVFSTKVVVFAFDSVVSLCLFQSRVHSEWGLFLGSSLEDRPVYTPLDCFDTFPSPVGWECNSALSEAGRRYDDFRAALMVRNNEGLTKTYNRFHDPDERDPDILKLRDLHDAMDRAVLDAYGWTDIQPRCEFILDYEDDEEETPGKPSKRRKPWRYRWPDDIRDEVLARLLELNARRAEAEELTVATRCESFDLGKKRGRHQKTRHNGPLLA
ncbi:MAG: class I SAM-dependent DNA methyltransferase, partial [Pseudomonadota bacterium]